MKVQATKQGFYDNVLREPGEVFELFNDANGEMPLKMDRTYEKDKDGKMTGEYTEEVHLGKDGNPVHADYAPDGEELRGRGAFRGETFTPGWMVQVPDDTEIGIYPPEQKFSAAGKEAPRPISRIIKPANEPANLAQMTPMRGKPSDRKHRSA
jgi:hypothetical protein